MIGLLPQELGGQRHQHGAAGAVVAAQSRLGRVDDLLALPLRLRPGAQRHGVHVRHEEQPVGRLERAAAGQVDDEVAGLGRQGNAGVGIVEADGARGHAGLLQRRDQLLADLCFPAGHAFDRQEAHEALDRGLRVDNEHAWFLPYRPPRNREMTMTIAAPMVETRICVP